MRTLFISAAMAALMAAVSAQAEPVKLTNAQLAQTSGGVGDVNITLQQNIAVAGQGGAAVAVSINGNANALIAFVSVIRQRNIH